MAAKALILCWFALIGLTSSQQPFEVKWADQRLTVRAAAAPLADVVREVSRLTGVEVIGGEKLTGAISTEFTTLPLEEGLARVLAQVNYAVKHEPGRPSSADHRLVVHVLSMSGGVTDATLTGPMNIPALESRLAAEAEEVAEEKEEDADDPDMDDLRQEETLQLAKLNAKDAFGPKATVASLVKLFDNPPNDADKIRVEALKALGSRPMPEVQTVLVRALTEDSWDVRMAAVEILSRATDPDSLRGVGRIVEENPEENVRLGALKVLALRADDRSVVQLRSVLEKETDTDMRAVIQDILTEFERRERAKREAAAKR